MEPIDPANRTPQPSTQVTGKKPPTIPTNSINHLSPSIKSSQKWG